MRIFFYRAVSAARPQCLKDRFLSYNLKGSSIYFSVDQDNRNSPKFEKLLDRSQVTQENLKIVAEPTRMLTGQFLLEALRLWRYSGLGFEIKLPLAINNSYVPELAF